MYPEVFRDVVQRLKDILTSKHGVISQISHYQIEWQNRLEGACLFTRIIYHCPNLWPIVDTAPLYISVLQSLYLVISQTQPDTYVSSLKFALPYALLLTWCQLLTSLRLSSSNELSRCCIVGSKQQSP